MVKGEPQRRELTDRFIKTVKPSPKRMRYWDTRERGLVLQVEPWFPSLIADLERLAGSIQL